MHKLRCSCNRGVFKRGAGVNLYGQDWGNLKMPELGEPLSASILNVK